MVRFLSIDMTCVRRRHSMGTCWIVVRVSIDMGVNTTIISYGFDAALPTSHATGVTLQNICHATDMTQFHHSTPIINAHCKHHRSDSQQPPLRSPCILGRAAMSVAAKAAETLVYVYINSISIVNCEVE